MRKVRKIIQKIKQKIYKWLMPEDDYRRFLMSRVYEPYVVYEHYETETLSTQVVLNQKSYEFLHSGEGTEKYDAVYGLTRQLADSLRPYVKYTESYDEAHDEWTCRVDLKVVVE